MVVLDRLQCIDCVYLDQCIFQRSTKLYVMTVTLSMHIASDLLTCPPVSVATVAAVSSSALAPAECGEKTNEYHYRKYVTSHKYLNR